MTAAPAIKGWCPTLLTPMQSGDGWLARVKPQAATISAEHARIVADTARRHGNSHIDLTSRANLQVRGLTPRSAELFAETIIAAGLASANVAVEAIRNVMASPLGRDDPTASFDAHALAREIEAMLGAEPSLLALPDKFGILVDGGGVLGLSGASADIAVRMEGPVLAVRLDGGAREALLPPSAVASAVKALLLAALHLSWERREPPCRMRALIGAVGEEAIFASADLASIVPPPADMTSAPRSVGFIAYPGRDDGAFGVGLPFGRIDADALASLASLSIGHGDGTLRTTPWRALLVPGIAAVDAAAIAVEIEALGLIADPADPRLRIAACVGAPSCANATVDTRRAATRIATLLPRGNETVHVSGCAKSCALRGPASLTLVGRDGRYDLIRDGAVSDRPSLMGLSLDDVVAIACAAKEPAA